MWKIHLKALFIFPLFEQFKSYVSTRISSKDYELLMKDTFSVASTSYLIDVCVCVGVCFIYRAISLLLPSIILADFLHRLLILCSYKCRQMHMQQLGKCISKSFILFCKVEKEGEKKWDWCLCCNQVGEQLQFATKTQKHIGNILMNVASGAASLPLEKTNNKMGCTHTYTYTLTHTLTHTVATRWTEQNARQTFGRG